MDEHLYLVVYDIRDQRRWRRIYRLMHGYGEWLQLSVFQCRLDRRRHAELVADLDGARASGDHIVIIDIGVADRIEPKVVSLGESFQPIDRGPTIV